MVMGGVVAVASKSAKDERELMLAQMILFVVSSDIPTSTQVPFSNWNSLGLGVLKVVPR